MAGPTGPVATTQGFRIWSAYASGMGRGMQVIVLLLAGEEKFERSICFGKERCPVGGPMCCVWSLIWSRPPIDAWSGRGGLLIHVLLVSLLPMLSTEKEFERSIGVVLKRDDEQLGMPH